MLLKVSCSLFSAIAVQFVRSSDGWSIFYETKKSRFINTVCFWLRMIKGYMEITEWKHTVESVVHGTLK